MQWITRLPFFVVLMGLGAIAMLLPAAHGAVVEDFTTMRVFFYGFILFSVLTLLIALTMSGYAPVNIARSQLTGLLAAFSVLPLAQVYTILFAAPLLITVLAIPVLGETVRIRRWAAVIVGLIGVLVVLRPGSTELSLGHLAALMAAVGGSIASIIVRKIGSEERPVVMLLYPMALNFVVMAAALPFVYEPMPIDHLGLLGVIAVFGWIASRMIISAYQAGEAAIIAPMQYSQIIWASFFGFVFFGEMIDLNTAVGASIIIASGLYIVLRESRSGASENTPVLRTRSRSETGIIPRISMLVRMSGKTLPGQQKAPD